MSIVKSALGQEVDFDLLRMKEQLANKPRNSTADARQKAVNAKRRRGSGKVLQNLLDTMKDDANKTSKHESPSIVDTSNYSDDVEKTSSVEAKIKISKVKRNTDESTGE